MQMFLLLQYGHCSMCEQCVRALVCTHARVFCSIYFLNHPLNYTLTILLSSLQRRISCCVFAIIIFNPSSQIPLIILLIMRSSVFIYIITSNIQPRAGNSDLNSTSSGLSILVMLALVSYQKSSRAVDCLLSPMVLNRRGFLCCSFSHGRCGTVIKSPILPLFYSSPEYQIRGRANTQLP